MKSRLRQAWEHFEEQKTFYKVALSKLQLGSARWGGSSGWSVLWDSGSAKYHLNENQELSRPNSSPITQRLEPHNQVSSETNWKFVEHKTDDSQILDFESMHVRKADICWSSLLGQWMHMCGTNRMPHCKQSLNFPDSEINNTLKW